MVEAKQRDEWSRTITLLEGVRNLFRERKDHVDLTTLMPDHLREGPSRRPLPTPAEAGAAMGIMRRMFEDQFGV